MSTYSDFLALQSGLADDPRIIDSVVLYPFDDKKVYAGVMNALAQDLPSGKPSPFSNQSPGSAHGILVENLVFLLSLYGHELALMPNAMLLQWMRLWGAQKRQAEYPIIELTFTRDNQSLRANIPGIVPTGTQISSQNDPSLKAITQEDLEISGSSVLGTVPARLNRLGTAATLQRGEFNGLPRLLAGVSSVTSGKLLYEGRDSESVTDSVMRMRERMQIGDRAVTDIDFVRIAQEAGAMQRRMIRGRVPHVFGFHRDLRTLAVYPAGVASAVDELLRTMNLRDERRLVHGAELIPVDGTITIKADGGITDYQAQQVAVQALIDGVNPPNGIWGDRSLASAVGEALERVEGIYAVPLVQLRHAETLQPLSELQGEPWQLYQLQKTLTIEVER